VCVCVCVCVSHADRSSAPRRVWTRFARHSADTCSGNMTQNLVYEKALTYSFRTRKTALACPSSSLWLLRCCSSMKHHHVCQPECACVCEVNVHLYMTVQVQLFKFWSLEGVLSHICMFITVGPMKKL